MTDIAAFGVSFESSDLLLPAAPAGGKGAGAAKAADADAGSAPGHVLKSLLPAGKPRAQQRLHHSVLQHLPATLVWCHPRILHPRVLSHCSPSLSLSLFSGSLCACLRAPPGKKLPVKRAIKYTNLTLPGFSFTLAYNASAHHGLPPGVTQPLLGSYTVAGIDTVVARCAAARAMDASDPSAARQPAGCIHARVHACSSLTHRLPPPHAPCCCPRQIQSVWCDGAAV